MKDNRKRVIVDFKKLTPGILAMLVDKYPDGYDDDHIITFRNAKNEIIDAVEVTTDDTKYLVKVSTKLVSGRKGWQTRKSSDGGGYLQSVFIYVI